MFGTSKSVKSLVEKSTKAIDVFTTTLNSLISANEELTKGVDDRNKQISSLVDECQELATQKKTNEQIIENIEKVLDIK